MSFWTRHQVFEKNSIILIVGILAVIAIGGLVEITPLFYLKSTIEVGRRHQAIHAAGTDRAQHLCREAAISATRR